jgi:hypothetical protein
MQWARCTQNWDPGIMDPEEHLSKSSNLGTYILGDSPQKINQSLIFSSTLAFISCIPQSAKHSAEKFEEHLRWQLWIPLTLNTEI